MSEANTQAGGTVLPPGGIIASPTESRYWESWANKNSTSFENLDFFEQQEKRAATTGTIATIDAYRAGGLVDTETHAILTGRFNGNSPEDLRTYFERLSNAMEENNRLMRRQTDAIEKQ